MKLSSILFFIGILSLSAGAANAQSGFGTSEDISYGNTLWNVLLEQKLVGEGAIMARPYEGTQPHGQMLVTLETEIEVNGQRGELLVKRNYAGDNITMEAVSNNPRAYLNSTTVMFRRDGYDPDNGNWFWAKYFPDGSYDTAPNGTPLVGRAAGCIACHSMAEGDDMVYLNDRY